MVDRDVEAHYRAARRRTGQDDKISGHDVKPLECSDHNTPF